MKTFSSVVIGAALVVILLSFLASSATDAMVLVQPCSVEEDGSGTHPTIQAAVSDVSCDPINVGAGTFIETVTISRSVTVQGLGQAMTNVDGNAAGTVFTIQTGNVVTLTNLTILNGSAHAGGGIVNVGTLYVTNSNIISNSASWDGGGIHNNGVLNIVDSNISGNSATDWGGGGIFNGGGSTTLMVLNTLVDNNSAYYGGGIYNDSGQNVSIIQSTISNNSANGGGGLGNDYLGVMLVSHSMVSGNSANWSGGIGNGLGTMTVTHSTVSGNSAVNSAGGISAGTNISISHSTIYNNSAGVEGGGIHVFSGTVQIANTIVAGSLSGGDCYVNIGSINSQGYNLDSDGSCNLTAMGDLPNTDPLLGPLQDNGGPTWTQALLAGSPALDAGSCPGVTADQRGFPRPVDIPAILNAADGCDMGAFELEIPDLILAKNGPAIAAAGDFITYVLTVTNALPFGLSDVVLTDTIPANATYISGGTLVGNVVSWTLPSVTTGATFTRSFVVTATETITNDDYRVSASGGYSTTSSVPVVTIVVLPITGLEAGNDSPTVIGNATNLMATIASGSDVNFTWSFGDGNAGSGAVTSHIYPTVGYYTAVVTASNPLGELTATTAVTITDAAITGLAASNDSPTVLGSTTNLMAIVTGGTNINYTWDFGDNSAGSGQNPSHTYPDVGIYTAVVTASNTVNSITASTVVTITDVPITGLIVSNDGPTIVGNPTTLTAVVTTGTNVNFAWAFGDGGMASGAVVTHTYPNVGQFTAVVTASNSSGTVVGTTIVTIESDSWTIYLPSVLKAGGNTFKAGQPAAKDDELREGSIQRKFVDLPRKSKIFKHPG